MQVRILKPRPAGGPYFVSTRDRLEPEPAGDCCARFGVPVKRMHVTAIDRKGRPVMLSMTEAAYGRLLEKVRRSRKNLHATLRREQRLRWNKQKKQRRARTGRK